MHLIVQAIRYKTGPIRKLMLRFQTGAYGKSQVLIEAESKREQGGKSDGKDTR